MCRFCQARKTSERIARQIKNIDDGGAISLSAVREVLAAAQADIDVMTNAYAAMTQVANGAIAIEIAALPVDEAPGGIKH